MLAPRPPWTHACYNPACRPIDFTMSHHSVDSAMVHHPFDSAKVHHPYGYALVRHHPGFATDFRASTLLAPPGSSFPRLCLSLPSPQLCLCLPSPGLHLVFQACGITLGPSSLQLCLGLLPTDFTLGFSSPGCALVHTFQGSVGDLQDFGVIRDW